MRDTRPKLALMVLPTMIAALPAAAYVYPLSTTDIRDAYMTAQRNDWTTANFLTPYSHAFAAPEKGAHVAMISILTPLYQAVEASGKTGYHSLDAERDFLGKPLDLIVRVQINFTASFSESISGPRNNPGGMPPITDDVWHVFKITLTQDKEIAYKSRQDTLIYGHHSRSTGGAAGLVMEQHYDPKDVGSDWVTVKVDTPDMQHVESRFDLLKLR